MRKTLAMLPQRWGFAPQTVALCNVDQLLRTLSFSDGFPSLQCCLCSLSRNMQRCIAKFHASTAFRNVRDLSNDMLWSCVQADNMLGSTLAGPPPDPQWETSAKCSQNEQHSKGGTFRNHQPSSPASQSSTQQRRRHGSSTAGTAAGGQQPGSEQQPSALRCAPGGYDFHAAALTLITSRAEPTTKHGPGPSHASQAASVDMVPACACGQV